MPSTIKAITGQSFFDLCLMGQGSLDRYVEFLQVNDISPNTQPVSGEAFTLVTEPDDANFKQLIQGGLTFATLGDESAEETGSFDDSFDNSFE